ncbi:MAG: hypothetical protein ACFFFC_15080 [Candidatus Thorarchaeota archaeon]
MKVSQSKTVFDEFSQKHGVDIRFSPEQYDLLEKNQDIVLSPRQMDDLVSQLSSQDGMVNFLEETASQIPAVCMSLYVLNDSLWRMMERKPWDQNKMLAMSTMPYCYWDKNQLSTSNPKAVKRWELGSNELTYMSAVPSLSIEGNGGDFNGFIEQSMITNRRFGIPDTNRPIPNFQFKGIKVTAQLSEADVIIHPKPLDIFDYDFSAPAKTFHDLGVDIIISGEYVTLEIENRKPAKLHGDVHILIGVPVDFESQQFGLLFADVWFWAFRKTLEAAE